MRKKKAVQLVQRRDFQTPEKSSPDPFQLTLEIVGYRCDVWMDNRNMGRLYGGSEKIRYAPKQVEFWVGPYLILLSAEDKDLRKYRWCRHQSGRFYRRPTVGPGGQRMLIWLHRVIGQRIEGLDYPPQRVRLLGGQLDYRRENLDVRRA